MYICICNGLREEDCHEALACGAASAVSVYAHHGCAPKCGRCMEDMEQMLIRHSITVQHTEASSAKNTL